MSDTRVQVRLADRCSALSTAWLHCPLVVCFSCVTADFFLCHSCLVALLSQSYLPTRPIKSKVVTRPLTGSRDVHLLGSWCCSVRSAVFLCCGGTRRLRWFFGLVGDRLLLVGDRLSSCWRPSSLRLETSYVLSLIEDRSRCSAVVLRRPLSLSSFAVVAHVVCCGSLVLSETVFFLCWYFIRCGLRRCPRVGWCRVAPSMCSVRAGVCLCVGVRAL